MPRSITELLRNNLDRAAIPIDEGGSQLFSEDNPGYMLDEVTQAALAALATEAATILSDLIEHDDHFHNDELWWGVNDAPNETNAIESNVDQPFTAASGNNTWGVAIPVIGSKDNPAKIWQTRFDMHRIAISGVDNGTPWKLRFLYGDQSLEEAAQARRYTETVSIASGVGSNIGAGPSELRLPILPVGWRVWCQVWNQTNLDTISFFVGVHGYPVLEYGNE